MKKYFVPSIYELIVIPMGILLLGILLFCIGSGTTAVAAINAGRHYIGIEKNPEYVTIARNRAAEAHGQTKLSITEWEDGI